MIHFLVPAERDFTLTEYFSLEPPSLVRRFRVTRYEELAALSRCERGPWVLAALDQLTPGMLRLVTQFSEQLTAEGVRVLNDPKRTLHRFDLLTTLHRLHRNVFRIVRAGTGMAGLRYPVFLREATPHDGSLSPLLNSAGEVEGAIGRALLQGHRFADLVLIEFCSTVGEDGLYRKYAAFKVGDHILARSLNAGRSWMLKLENSEYTKALALEEQEYVFSNPHTAELAELFAIAGVGYGQIDYGLQEGRIQTWEINLHATIGRGTGPRGGPGPPEIHPIRNETREYFFDRFREAWEALDVSAGAQPPIAVAFDQELIAAARRRPAPAGRVRRFALRLLRPFKPVLEPLAAPLLRALGAWMTRLRSR